MDIMDRTFTPSSGLRTIAVDENIVLVDQKSGMYYGLNTVGSSIWLLLEQGKRGAEMASSLAEEYRAEDETLIADTSRLLKELLSSGLIE